MMRYVFLVFAFVFGVMAGDHKLGVLLDDREIDLWDYQLASYSSVTLSKDKQFIYLDYARSDKAHKIDLQTMDVELIDPHSTTTKKISVKRFENEEGNITDSTITIEDEANASIKQVLKMKGCAAFPYNMQTHNNKLFVRVGIGEKVMKLVHFHDEREGRTSRLELAFENIYSLHIYDLSTGSMLLEIKDPEDSVENFAPMPDKNLVLIENRLAGFSLFNMQTGEMIYQIKGYPKDEIVFSSMRGEGTQKNPGNIAVSPNGEFFMTINRLGSQLKKYSVDSGKLLDVTQLNSATFMHRYLRFLSTRVLILQGIGTLTFWDLKTGGRVVDFYGYKDGEWIVKVANGYFNASKNTLDELLGKEANTEQKRAQKQELLKMYAPQKTSNVLKDRLQ